MSIRLDHVVIGAHTCEQGVAATERVLGVTVPAGGKHPLMSTHNHLARAGDGCFIEIIAIDPDAPDPDRPRWFSLDDPATRMRLEERPRPLCWVVNTACLDTVHANSPVELGQIVELSRGDHRWRLTVPPDGSLPEHGLLPAFIEWPPGPHPSTGMADLGVERVTVELAHPQPDRLHDTLDALGVAHLATVRHGARPELSFRMRAPSGQIVVLS